MSRARTDRSAPSLVRRTAAALDHNVVGAGAGLLALLVLVLVFGAAPAALAIGLLALLIVD